MTTTVFSPGSLVRARGREWMVLGGSDAQVLRVRPLTGSEDDQTVLHVGLEAEPITEATFPLPAANQEAGHDAALLLRDALLLSLRRGAGPFRSFGEIAVEPRAYQLVPLLMALKLDPIRLLVADDVGVGKTIEGALIAREMIDRGDTTRTAVLCPPHLVDQWVTELWTRFHIRSVAITAGSASRLERDLPPGDSVFHQHPHTVVSLDYIKSEKRRADFLRACPDFVIVDEAHTCAATGAGRHQRYELLRGLAASPTRHLVLLTATPHSGDEAAFFRLLGLLHPDFEKLEQLEGDERAKLRERLGQHFVQRRRPDIAEWRDGTNIFPKRETTELTYRLTGAWEDFFSSVLSYCAAVIEAAGGDARKQRLSFWGTLALMRCVASSPAAAVQALRTRAGVASASETEDEALRERIFDGSSDALPEDDVEPPSADVDADLNALIAMAEKLVGHADDPKLKTLTAHLQKLVADGFNPVVFCRYIASAHYLARHLEGKFKNVTIGVVTGEVASAERIERVEELGDAERRLLIATDCLSEGINLQDHFDAVVHYDLSWNPTRHEQREGRVDRFLQKSPVVRTTLLYGANNPVDGAVLEVILRKAEKIREELGVPVPLPDDQHTLTQALMKAVLLRGQTPTASASTAPRRAEQAAFSFVEMDEAKQLEIEWTAAAQKAKQNFTIFAQRRIKPEQVLPEWRKALAAIGGSDDVKRFTQRALARLGAALEPMPRGFKAPLSALPDEIRERLYADGLAQTMFVDFAVPPAPRCKAVHRSHPLVTVLAESLLERTLSASEENASDPSVLGRVGCWTAAAITQRTVVALLRMRHQLTIKRERSTTPLLVEEAAALAWAGSTAAPLEGDAALSLLTASPLGEPPPHVRRRAVEEALVALPARLTEVNAFAGRRAETLLADHRGVRDASEARGSYSVRALLPADVIGLFVLLPAVH